jgi:4-amino-4-deoxy-L-arabinose transferase-like glycosyltransferase
MLKSSRGELIILVLCGLIFLGSIFAPPHLMDDVDASFAQIGRNMYASGDWVTPHLNGVRDMEKPPLLFWLMAASYSIFGVHDWSARLPLAVAAIALCWLTFRLGRWAFGGRAGFLSGVVLATCVGMYLFTRVFFVDVLLALAVVSAIFCFLQAMEPDATRPRLWALGLGVSLGVGILAKGLIALVLPGGACIVYLLLTRQFKWRILSARVQPLVSIPAMLLIAVPWHVLAAVRNPPVFVFTLHSGPGQYHGFLWFYFINEQLLRFLNLRYPRDYSTVPRLQFWLLNLVWMFPWSAYSPAVVSSRFTPANRAGRLRLLCLCWAGFLLIFFSFSTTQEYYVLGCMPAFALLLGSALTSESVWIARGTRFLTVLFVLGAVAIGAVLFMVRGVPAPGDISSALVQHPEDYYLSTGHFHDLTLASFAYLRIPLILAGIALLIGIFGTLRSKARPVFAVALLMVLFEFAAHRAIAVFDPYLSSEPLAASLLRSPAGQLIIDGAYYPFSSVFFYSQRPALLLNGRVNDLEYGSNAPDCPPVYIKDADFTQLWKSSGRMYFVTDGASVSRLETRMGQDSFHLVAAIGGKSLYTNQSLK